MVMTEQDNDLGKQHWCRVEKCIHNGTYHGDDKNGKFWLCTLAEITINRDGKCDDMEVDI